VISSGIYWLSLIIFALLACVPSAIVFLSFKTREQDQDSRITASLVGKEDLSSLQKESMERIRRIEELDAKILNMGESLSAFINRQNARERVYKKEEERNRQEDPTPDLKQEELFKNLPFIAPPNNQTEQPKMALRRKVG
jgi:hypothetical protein